MTELSGKPGFVPRAGTSLSKGRALGLELVATVALTASLVVAATAVSLGNKSFTRSGKVPQAAFVSVPQQH
jgi:hypothetical protein